MAAEAGHKSGPVASANATEGEITNAMFGNGDNDDDDTDMITDEQAELARQDNNNNNNNVGFELPQRHSKFVGLLNQGATCYLNSLLQSLYFTPELRQGLYEMSEQELGIDDKEEFDELNKKVHSGKYTFKDEDLKALENLGYSQSRGKRALVKAEMDVEKAKQLLTENKVPTVRMIPLNLRRFFAHLQIGCRDSISTSDVTDSFGWRGSQAQVQHDAHELNQILLDAIERSLKHTQMADLANTVYEGRLVRRTFCLDCEYCSEREESFLNCLVDVENLKNLLKSFEHQTKAEYLVADNKYFCEKCNKKSDAKRSMAYTHLPDVLTVGLKRFVFDYQTFNRVKYTEDFPFPLILDMAPYLQENLQEQITRTEDDEKLIEQENKEAEEKRKKLDAAKRKREEDAKKKEEEKKKQQEALKRKAEKADEKEKEKNKDNSNKENGDSKEKDDKDKNDNKDNKEETKPLLALTLDPANDRPVNDGNGGDSSDAPKQGPQNNPQKAPMPQSTFGPDWYGSGYDEDAELAAALAASWNEFNGGGGGAGGGAGGDNGGSHDAVGNGVSHDDGNNDNHEPDLEAGMYGANRPRSDSTENEAGDDIGNEKGMNEQSDLMLALQLSQQDQRNEIKAPEAIHLPNRSGGDNDDNSNGEETQREYSEMAGVNKGKGMSNNGKNERKLGYNEEIGDFDQSYVEQAPLTFVECVKKFNYHKAGGFYDRRKNINRFRPCFLQRAFPNTESILLRFCDTVNEEMVNDSKDENGETISFKFFTLKQKDFPTKDIEFDKEKYYVDNSFSANGLTTELAQYDENAAEDEGCEFYYLPTQERKYRMLINSHETFRKVLSNPHDYAKQAREEEANTRIPPHAQFSKIETLADLEKHGIVPGDANKCFVGWRVTKPREAIIQIQILRLNEKSKKAFFQYNQMEKCFGSSDKGGFQTLPSDDFYPCPDTQPTFQWNGDEYETGYSGSGGGNKFSLNSRRDERGYGSGNYNSRPVGPQYKLEKFEYNPKSKHLYMLTGIVIHRGTPFAGHYHAYIRDFLKDSRKEAKELKEKENEKDNESEKKENSKEKEKDNEDNKNEKDIEMKDLSGEKDDANVTTGDKNNSETKPSTENKKDDRIFDVDTDTKHEWYDFDDASISKISRETVAKQYGGKNECAYMLYYRKIDISHEIPPVPNDLIEYIRKDNEKMEIEWQKKVASMNKLQVRILHPRCFTVEDGKLSMRPFVEGLLKECIRVWRLKQQRQAWVKKQEELRKESGDLRHGSASFQSAATVTTAAAAIKAARLPVIEARINESDFDPSDDRTEEEKEKDKDKTEEVLKAEKAERMRKYNENEEKEIQSFYDSETYPSQNDLGFNEIHKTVMKYYDDQCIFLDTDKRNDVDTLLPAAIEALKANGVCEGDPANGAHLTSFDKCKFHFIKIPHDLFDNIPSITTLLSENVASRVGGCWLPFGGAPKTKTQALKGIPENKSDDNGNMDENNNSKMRSKEKEKEEKKEEKEKDEESEAAFAWYPYHKVPKKVTELPINVPLAIPKLCFVWDGEQIAGQKFNLQGSQTMDILVRFYKSSENKDDDTPTFIEKKLSFPFDYSLSQCYNEIINKKGIDSFGELIEENGLLQDSKYPVFTLMSEDRDEAPTVMYPQIVKDSNEDNKENEKKESKESKVESKGESKEDRAINEILGLSNDDQRVIEKLVLEWIEKKKFVYLLHEEKNPFRHWALSDPLIRNAIGSGKSLSEVIAMRESGVSAPRTSPRGMAGHEGMSSDHLGHGLGMGGAMDDMGMGFAGSNRIRGGPLYSYDDMNLGARGPYSMRSPSSSLRKPIICFESPKGLENPFHESRAFKLWKDKTKFVTLNILDRTPIGMSSAKENDGGISGVASNEQGRTFEMKIAKRTGMPQFFDKFRELANIPKDMDLICWDVKGGHKWLVGLDWAFIYSMELMIECGHYPHDNLSVLLDVGVKLESDDSVKKVSDIKWETLTFKTNASIKQIKNKCLEVFGLRTPQDNEKDHNDDKDGRKDNKDDKDDKENKENKENKDKKTENGDGDGDVPTSTKGENENDDGNKNKNNKKKQYTHKEFVAYDASDSNGDLNHLQVFYNDNQSINRIDLKNGNRILLVQGKPPQRTVEKQVFLMQDCRTLGKVWDYSETNWTPLGSVSSQRFYNDQIICESLPFDVLGTTYDDVRKKIYQLPDTGVNGMDSLRLNVKSHEYLLLSWHDFVNKRPLSYPVLRSGKMEGQKQWDTNKKAIVFQILKNKDDATAEMKGPLTNISNYARYLHCFAGKIVPKGKKDEIFKSHNKSMEADTKSEKTNNDSKMDEDSKTKNEASTGTASASSASASAAATENDKSEESGKTKTEETKTEEKNESDDNKKSEDKKEDDSKKEDLLSNVEFLYWPPDRYIRYLYDEGENKVTYSKLVKFFCDKFEISNEEDCVITLFNISTQSWVVCDESNDGTSTGMIGQPFQIKQTARDSQIIVVFDLSLFEFPTEMVETYGVSRKGKIEWMSKTMEKWDYPPVTQNAKFLFAHWAKNAQGTFSNAVDSIMASRKGGRSEGPDLKIFVDY